jgi:hypothetical protein
MAALLSPLPNVLAADGDAPTVNVTPARQAWLAWIAPGAGRAEASTTPESLTSLARHLEAAFPVLVSAVTAVDAAAADEVASRDDQWVPVAADVAAWCSDAAKARSGSTPVVSLKLARKWRATSTAFLRRSTPKTGEGGCWSGSIVRLSVTRSP